MTTIVLEAETRTDSGKGASRRLRRLENKIPAIIYGGDKKAKTIHLQQNKVLHALENESIYSSVFDLHVDGKVEHVILKDIQRHPYKPVILHMDLQRVTSKDVLVKSVPLHFINESTAKGVKAGGIINHNMNQVEIRCQAKDLPEFIEVDMADVEMDGVIHLQDLKLPKGVQLAVKVTDSSHNLAVVGIHEPRMSPVEEEEVPESAEVPTVSESEEEEEGSAD